MTVTCSIYKMLTIALICKHFEHLNPFNPYKIPMRQRSYPYCLEKTLYMTYNSYSIWCVQCAVQSCNGCGILIDSHHSCTCICDVVPQMICFFTDQTRTSNKLQKFIGGVQNLKIKYNHIIASMLLDFMVNVYYYLHFKNEDVEAQRS